MSPAPRIALLIEAASAYDRGVLLGIARYARTRGNWTFGVNLREPWFRDIQRITSGSQGIIVELTDPKQVDLVAQLNLPTVNVGECAAVVPFPLVTCNQQAIGQLAAEHLLQAGLTRFAYVGHLNQYNCDLRRKSFMQKIQEAGHPCERFQVDPLVTNPVEEIATWLSTVHTPLGVFAWDDLRARDVLEAARRVHMDVPEEMAVLGVGNDTLVSALSVPPLSSVRVPAQSVGQSAAELLDRLIAGAPARQSPIRIDPIGIAARLSSDALMISDSEVVKAVRFIRDNSNRALQVVDVLENVAMSRRSLERRFREHLGRSPQQEIQRVHLDRAKTLLADTELTITEVAAESGFRNPDRLAAVFRSALDQTPSDYRARFRHR